MKVSGNGARSAPQIMCQRGVSERSFRPPKSTTSCSKQKVSASSAQKITRRPTAKKWARAQKWRSLSFLTVSFGDRSECGRYNCAVKWSVLKKMKTRLMFHMLGDVIISIRSLCVTHVGTHKPRIQWWPFRCCFLRQLPCCFESLHYVFPRCSKKKKKKKKKKKDKNQIQNG